MTSSQPSQRQQRYQQRHSMPAAEDAPAETVTLADLKVLIESLRDDLKGLKDTIVSQGLIIADLTDCFRAEDQD
jgi:hypothetical protein